MPRGSSVHTRVSAKLGRTQSDCFTSNFKGILCFLLIFFLFVSQVLPWLKMEMMISFRWRRDDSGSAQATANKRRVIAEIFPGTLEIQPQASPDLFTSSALVLRLVTAGGLFPASGTAKDFSPAGCQKKRWSFFGGGSLLRSAEFGNSLFTARKPLARLSGSN